MKCTKQQRQVIAIMGRKRFDDDEEAYRDWLDANYGVRTPTKMSKAEAIHCIDTLNGKESRMLIWLSQQQLQKILALQQILNWSDDDLTEFVKRQTKCLRLLRMLTRHHATKVIVGLQRVAAKGDKAIYTALNQATAADIMAQIKKI